MRNIKFNLHACVVSGSCFELMLINDELMSINERTDNNRFSKNFYSKAHKLILKAMRVTQIWLVDPFTQVKSAEHMAKIIQHKSHIRALKLS